VEGLFKFFQFSQKPKRSDINMIEATSFLEGAISMDQCCQLQKRGLGRREDTIRPKIQSLGPYFIIWGEASNNNKNWGAKKNFGPESKFLGLILNILPKYLIYCDF